MVISLPLTGFTHFVSCDFQITGFADSKGLAYPLTGP